MGEVSEPIGRRERVVILMDELHTTLNQPEGTPGRGESVARALNELAALAREPEQVEVGVVAVPSNMELVLEHATKAIDALTEVCGRLDKMPSLNMQRDYVLSFTERFAAIVASWGEERQRWR